MFEKAEWIHRFVTRLLQLQPWTPCANLPQIAETFWYYTRHRNPEESAEARAAGALPALNRECAWIEACSQALRSRDPHLSEHETLSLAERLWDDDAARMVDPYVMADALWGQAFVMSLELKGHADFLRGSGPTDSAA